MCRKERNIDMTEDMKNWAPAVVAMEHQNLDTGLSLMITEEIPGDSVQDLEPGESLPGILQEAGRQLALLHQVPVEGFGWIDRSCHDRLRGKAKEFWYRKAIKTMHFFTVVARINIW